MNRHWNYMYMYRTFISVRNEQEPKLNNYSMIAYSRSSITIDFIQKVNSANWYHDDWFYFFVEHMCFSLVHAGHFSRRWSFSFSVTTMSALSFATLPICCPCYLLFTQRFLLFILSFSFQYSQGLYSFDAWRHTFSSWWIDSYRLLPSHNIIHYFVLFLRGFSRFRFSQWGFSVHSFSTCVCFVVLLVIASSSCTFTVFFRLHT